MLGREATDVDRWRRLVESLPQLIWTASRDGLVDYYSPQVSALTGTSPEAFHGWGWLDAVHPEDRVSAREQWSRAVADGAEYRTEHRVRSRDGEYRWLSCHATPMRDADNHITEWAGMSVDVTPARRSDAQTKRTLDLVMRLSRSSFWEVGVPDRDIDLASVMSGAQDDSLGVVPEDRDAVSRAMQRAIDGETPELQVEYRVRDADGAIRWRLTRGTVTRDASGTPNVISGVSLDITDLKLVEEQKRQATEFVRLATRLSGVYLWSYDLDGPLENAYVTYIDWESLGYEQPTERLDYVSSVKRVIIPEDQEAVMSAARAVLRGDSPQFDGQFRIVGPGGALRWNLGRGIVTRDEAGVPLKFLGTSVDITDQKALEHDLQVAREAAERANRAKDDFLANVSHEIRTPMNAILGMTELALDSSLTEHQRQLLSTVRSAARNLLGIINDLLDFSKIAAGKLALNEGHFGLRAEVGDTLQALATRANRKGLELICHVHPDVPDALVGDAGRVRQVLMNLVDNALKFTARGEVCVDVMLDPGALTAGDDVALAFVIRDTGIGIAHDKQASIFRPFEQEDSSTTRRYGGTGLGLTISVQLAALMNGAIAVASEPGHGSTFTFTARFARSSRPDDPVGPSPEKLEGLSVLVVDDNETNRRIVSTWLTNWQMRPTAVSNAHSALEELARSTKAGAPYSLVLLDGRMPDIDGITLANQIVERHGRDVPLVMLSSDDSPMLATRAREVGIGGYLLKPAEQSHLLQTIWLAVSGAGDEAASEVTAAAVRSPTLRILVAEDNELNTALLKTLLAKRGHRAQFADNGRVALERAAEAPFDLVLLDLHMPEVDGFEVVRVIRERERTGGGHLPIVALTARSSSRDRERCLAAGMDDFLAKPIESDALWATIDRIVSVYPPKGRRDSRLLDARVLLGACAGQAEILEQLCDVFRHGVPDHLTRIRAALLDRDLRTVAEVARKLFGTLCTFSTIASSVASTVEEAAREEDHQRCAELVAELDSMCTELVADTRGLAIEDLPLA